MMQPIDAAPAVTLAQLLAILSGLSAFSAIVVGAYRLGALSNRLETVSSVVLAKLMTIERFIEGTQERRVDWQGWREGMEQRLKATEDRMSHVGGGHP